ncbi:Uncharacterised protein [Vibrio alginolyticus]|nr:hypothetical protein XM68_c11459 [Vibrio alginolyticus]SUP18516.1 Uncharacterised protein [Vibrio alginolyticus]
MLLSVFPISSTKIISSIKPRPYLVYNALISRRTKAPENLGALHLDVYPRVREGLFRQMF